MAVLDFPHVGLVFGQKYPQPPVPGLPVYTWDGEKWITAGGDITGAPPATALPLMDATPAVVGTTVSYAREDHVHPVDTKAVRTEMAQSLSTTAQAQARTNIYVPPFDAMAYSGLQINGGMEVSQEFGSVGSSLSNGGKYVADGWRTTSSGVQTVTITQNPTTDPPGFASLIQMSVGTSNIAPGAGDHCFFSQKIEGYRISRLAWGTANAQPITLAFWVYAARPGNYSGSINNGATNRAYPFSFTISATNTWEYKTVTIPGDTTGTWTKDNSVGMQVNFTMMTGTTYQAPAGAWTAGSAIGVTGTINGVAATSDIMRLTGVTVLPGTQAPTAAQSPNIMRPYGEELVTCRRYWQTGSLALEIQSTSAGIVCTCPVMFSPVMRADPTMSTLTDLNNAFGSLAYQSVKPWKVGFQASTSSAGRHYFYGTSVADARL